MTEAQLLNGCIRNNVLAQKELYNKYAPKMMGVCFRYIPVRQEAQDVLQDAMLKVFKNIQKFSGKGSLEGWVRKVVVNTALEHIRKFKNIHLEEVQEVHFEQEGEASIIQQLKAKDLLKMIHSLPEGYRLVFNMYAIEGYNHREIAEKLNISEGTSKSQLSRARKQLQEMVLKEKVL